MSLNLDSAPQKWAIRVKKRNEKNVCTTESQAILVSKCFDDYRKKSIFINPLVKNYLYKNIVFTFCFSLCCTDGASPRLD